MAYVGGSRLIHPTGPWMAVLHTRLGLGYFINVVDHDPMSLERSRAHFWLEVRQKLFLGKCPTCCLSSSDSWDMWQGSIGVVPIPDLGRNLRLLIELRRQGSRPD